MARRPYFSGNYGSALGSYDTAAKLIAQSGQAQGQMFANLGQQIGGAIEKYAQNKKEGEAADMQIGAILQNMTPERQQEIASGESELGKSLSKFIDGELSNSKKKALLGSLMTVNTADQLKRKEQMDAQRFQQQQELAKLNVQIARQNLARQKDTNLQAKQNQMSENQFMQSLMSQTASPQAQRQADIARPGLPALGNGDARNRFMQAQLQQPQNQVPVSSLGSQDFGRFASREGLDPKLSVSRMEALRQAEQKPQKIARTITMQDGKGGFTQVGVDEAGNPIRDFGPPKPSGMYPTPKEKTEEIIAVNRTKDAMQTIKDKVNESNLAIKQAEQAELALTNLPETTGGITSFINDMKVLAESVGIDLPDEYQEDMKDIGIFRQVTGQFLFDAMENTKGSITENEMTLFRRISPDIDNSRAANEGMLKLYVKAGRRAKERKDLIRLSQKQRVDPILIQEKIEKFDEENSLMGDIQALAPNSDTKTKFNFNGQNIDVEIVGERKDGTPIYKDKKTGQVLVQQPAQ